MNRFLRKFKNKKFFRLFAVILLIFSLSLSLSFVRKPVLNLTRLPLKIFTFVKSEIGALIFFHRNFIQRDRFLKENDLLRYKLNSFEELAAENIRLKGLLGFKQKYPYGMVAAKVIGRSLDNWSSLIVVDKGSSSGIKADMAVITHLGFIGRVIETSRFSSKILLINDPQMNVSAIIQRSRQEGLVSGTLGTNLIMRYLGEDPDIQSQDTVLTSGLIETVPKGLLIGSVIAVGKEFSGLSYYALIKPAVNLWGIEEVLIVIS